MRSLTLDDLRLGFNDLLEEHADDLERSITGKLYRPLLEQKAAEIEGLPGAALGGAPFAAELAEADAAHDALGAAIFHLTQAIVMHPGFDETTKDLAQRAQQTFVPALGILQARYADQAAFALRKRPAFDELRPALERIPMPDGSNLATWVAAFLDQGDRIGRLLDERAEAGVGEVRAAHSVMAVRSTAVGLLGRFRRAIRDEMASSSDLPRDYEARLFAFLDQLDQSRREARKRRKPSQETSNTADSPSKDEPPVGG